MAHTNAPAPLAQLLAHAGVIERLVLRSRFGFLAYHGGSLEEQTDAIAESAASRAGASLYTVAQPPDLRWHLPSTWFDPVHSPRLAAFLDHVEVAVSIHGYGRDGMWTSVLLGGRHRALADHLAGHLRQHLDGYEVVDDLDAIPRELRGLHPSNPVNRCRGTGVQVELPPRVRGLGPRWADHPPGVPVPATEALVDALAGAARSWVIGATPATG